jgi:nitrite reductase/ring-hydroxylating ferredoxin subunit
MGKWVRALEVADLRPGQGKTVERSGVAFAVFNVEGRFHAIGNGCPHRGGPLGEGELSGTAVACPWHEWRIDVTTGATLRNPEVGVPTYRVEIRGTEVYVEIP